MSVEEAINRAKRSMKELEEEKRLKDLDEERLRRENSIRCPECRSQRWEKYGEWWCPKCRCHTWSAILKAKRLRLVSQKRSQLKKIESEVSE